MHTDFERTIPAKARPLSLLSIAVAMLCCGLPFTGMHCRSQEETDTDAEVSCPEGTTRSGDDCLVACPGLWKRGPDNKCRPPCLEEYDLIDGVCTAPCPEGAVLDGSVCVPEDREDSDGCPTDLYNDEGAEGELLFVNAAAAEGGDGSRAAPFGTLTEVADALASSDASAVSVLMGKGEYDIEGLNFALPNTLAQVNFLGRCARDTKWFATPGQIGMTLDSPDTEFGFHRLDVQGSSTQIFAMAAEAVIVESCAFSDWDNMAITVSVNGKNRFEMRDSTLSVDSQGPGAALAIQASRAVMESNTATVLGEDSAVVDFTGIDTLTFADNIITGTGNLAMKIDYSDSADAVALSRNHFDGNWDGSALYITGAADGRPAVSVEESVLNNRSDSGTSAALTLTNVADVSVRDLQVVSGGGVGIAVNDVGRVSVLESSIRDLPKTGVQVKAGGGSFEDCTVRVEHSHIEGMGQYAVYHADSLCDLDLVDNIFTDNVRGVWAKARAVSAEENDFAANEAYAFKAIQSSELSLVKNTFSGNENFAVDLSGLSGGADAEYFIDRNEIVDCEGVGISLRDIGEGTVMLTDNRISGMRQQALATADGETGVTGDGISIVSNTAEHPTTVQLLGNTVDRNARLGMIVHGKGASAEVSETSFEVGNGYLQLIETSGETPNLTAQSGAVVAGKDEDRAIEVADVFVAGDISSEEIDE